MKHTKATVGRVNDPGATRSRLQPRPQAWSTIFPALLWLGCSFPTTPDTGLDGGQRPSSAQDGEKYGAVQRGQYHLGPVDFSETRFHNACAPVGGYRRELHGATGLDNELLAGVSAELGSTGALCDACLRVTSDRGRSVTARIVTYGASANVGDIDLSPRAFDTLSDGEFPRAMSWQLIACPTSSPLVYEFQEASNPYWTSFWIRNPRFAVTRVYVQSTHHEQLTLLRREADGSFNDDLGFGGGEYFLQILGANGEQLSDLQPEFIPGELTQTRLQFH
jgi:hypothetical protein